MSNGDDGFYNQNIHSNTLQEHYIPSPIYLPLEDEAVFCDFFQQQQFFLNDHHEIMTNNVQSSNVESSNTNEHLVSNTHVEPDNNSPKKRSSNRSDRHSKINTARGPRDRRMRLSLDVAKKLFGLQDLLGFDKASETIDWLLTESKTAIQDLLHDRDCSFMGASNSASSTSECEVMSGSTGGQFMVKTIDDQETTKSCGIRKKQKEKVTRVRKCADFHRPLAKETRVRARQRAKERTIEKQNNYMHGVGQDSTFRPCIDQVMDQDVNQLGSWSTFHESERQIIDQFDEISSNFGFNQGFVGDNSCLLMTGNCSPFYYLDYQHSSGLIDELQFNCVQTNEKSFEGNNI